MNLRLIYPHVACALVALAHCGLCADGVKRSVEPVSGGCKVTLSWDFVGNVESDLIIEEHFAQGWAVVDSTVPFGSLDASWFSGNIARFAVKPAFLAEAGSISFVVASSGESSGAVAGNWKMYLGGTLRKGNVVGGDSLSAVAAASGSSAVAGSSSGEEYSVAIASFKIVSGGSAELAYAGLPKAGVLVVEGCEGLGKAWSELKRLSAAVGDGKVTLDKDEVGVCRFMRMKLLTEE